VRAPRGDTGFVMDCTRDHYAVKDARENLLASAIEVIEVGTLDVVLG